MSWSELLPRAAALALCGLLATACAFQPLYGPQGAGTKLNGKVAIAEPASQIDFVQSRELEIAFGPATAPAYRLDYTLTVRGEDAAITSGQEIDRVNLIGTLRYTLRALPGGTEVTTGTANGFVSYSSAGEPIATNSARNDAELRLSRILAGRTYAFVISDPKLSAEGDAQPDEAQ